jgi:Response receiver domain
MADASKAIEKAYIDPVRTVMLVDDRFRTFAQLARVALGNADAQPPERRYEDERAGELWEACRKRGWACDVENGPDFNAAVIDRIRKCDLVVLDFHLDGDDSAPSLKIMRALANSPGSNLVILYTRDGDLDGVRRRVASNLRGARKTESWLDDEHMAAWTDLREGTPTFTAEHIDAFFRNDRDVFQGDQTLRQQLEQADVPRHLQAKLIEAGLEDYLRRELDAEPLLESRPIDMSGRGASQGWVRQDNVFVVFVNKTDQSGSAVFDALETALGDWKPSALHLTAAYARESISRGGFRLDASALADADLRAGLLYYALEQESVHGFRHWYERLIQSVAEQAIEDVEMFGTTLIDPGAMREGNEGNMQRALELARNSGDRKPSEDKIIEALNDFLCSEPYRHKYVRTGTILCNTAAQGEPQYWICVTPACDMVPRAPPTGVWAHDLHPLKPMMVLRTKNAKMNTALMDPAHGRYVFFKHDKRRVAVEVIDGSTKQPMSEMMIVEGQAVTDADQCFYAYLVRQVGGAPSFGERIKMRAVAQLRTQYASRLLQDTGHHASRIGVDFVGLTNRKKKA